jgi:hypothetical protein
VTIADEQRGWRYRTVGARAAGPFEGFPAHKLAPSELIDTRVAGDAEEPGFDLEGDGWSAIPRTLGLFPGRQRQIVTVIGIAHEPLHLPKYGGIVRGEGFLDGNWITTRFGLGNSHIPTIEGLDYRGFMLGLRNNYEE